MAIYSIDDLLKKHGVTADSVKSVQPSQPAKEDTSFGQNVKDFGIGMIKGAASTVKATGELGRGLQSLLPKPLQGVPGPGKPADSRSTAFDSNSVKNNDLTDTLKSDNPAQTSGKVAELALELLFPISKVGEAFGATKKVGATFQGLGSKISNISDDVVDGGVKVKEKLIDLVSNLDDKTKSALTRTTQEQFQEVLTTGRNAMKTDEAITPLEVVGNKMVDALKQIKSQSSSIGEAKQQIMESAKVGYKKVGNIAQRSALNIQKAFSGIKLDPSDTKLIKGFQEELMKLGNNPSLREVDATIDLLQDKLYKTGRSSAVDVTDRVTGLLRGELGKLNGSIQDLGGAAYKKANADYSELIKIVGELNSRLGKEAGQAGSLVKRLFSPSDARTKELFKQLQKLTGEDYFKDARLAKFVMEALGDARAASLLEQIPKTAAGAIDRAVKFIGEKIQDPIKGAERFIDKVNR